MNLRKLLFNLSLVFLVFIICQSVQGDELEVVMKNIKAGDIFEINKVLASPEMEGRLSGTEGYNRASRWAAAKFKEWGLRPLYGRNFLQPFAVSYNEMRETTFALIVPPKIKGEEPKTLNMEIYKDFCPTLYSGFGEVEAEVVLAGYGITDAELGWDDYKDVDVKGKVVAIFHGTPQVEGKDFSKYSERHLKLDIAKKQGAAGLILIQRAVVSGNGNYTEGLPMVMVGDQVAEILFSPRGYSVSTVKALLRDGQYLSFATGIKVKIKSKGVHHDQAVTFNVVGLVEGRDPALKSEYIIFGGHLDHLGPYPVLHPGANDNASGSAVVMALAQAFSKLKKHPKRTIVFALFGAEELGLLGSKYFVANPPEFLSRPLLMINHDMNGAGNSLVIAGGETYPELFEIMKKLNERYALVKSLSATEISPVGGNSDYAPFLVKGIPAYSNWPRGGQAGGTHTAEDSIYAISPKIMEDIARLYFIAVYEFADK